MNGQLKIQKNFKKSNTKRCSTSFIMKIYKSMTSNFYLSDCKALKSEYTKYR